MLWRKRLFVQARLRSGNSPPPQKKHQGRGTMDSATRRKTVRGFFSRLEVQSKKEKNLYRREVLYRGYLHESAMAISRRRKNVRNVAMKKRRHWSYIDRKWGCVQIATEVCECRVAVLMNESRKFSDLYAAFLKYCRKGQLRKCVESGKNTAKKTQMLIYKNSAENRGSK